MSNYNFEVGQPVLFYFNRVITVPAIISQIKDGMLTLELHHSEITRKFIDEHLAVVHIDHRIVTIRDDNETKTYRHAYMAFDSDYKKHYEYHLQHLKVLNLI